MSTHRTNTTTTSQSFPSHQKHHLQKQQEQGPNDISLCQVCNQKESQYTCPRCYLRTCSLVCCHAHKQPKAATTLGCSGKRDVTAYVSMSQMDDNTLSSDYHFLNGGTQQVDSCKRLWSTMISADDDARTNDGHQKSTFQHQRHHNHKGPKYNGKSNIHSDIESGTVDDVTEPHPILQASEVSKMSSLTRLPWIQQHSNTSNKLYNNNYNNKKKSDMVSFSPLQVGRTSGVHLLVLPSMMERHQMNQSGYNTVVAPTNDNRKSKLPTLHWTVEICYVSFDQNENKIDDHQSSSNNSHGSNMTQDGFTSRTTATSGKSNQLSPTVQQRLEQNGQQRYSTTPMILHAIPETITIQQLHTQAIAALAQQSSTEMKTSMSSKATIADTTKTVTEQPTDVHDTDGNHWVVWLMKKIPCPADCPTYTEIGTSSMDVTSRLGDTISTSISSSHSSTFGGGDRSTTPTPANNNPSSVVDLSPADASSTIITLADMLRNTTIIEFPTLYMIPKRQYDQKLKFYFPCTIQEVQE
jgi:hypothetical protein